MCSTSHQLLEGATFDTTPAGYVKLLAWLMSFELLDAVGIEGTGTYGAGLARFLTDQGVPLIEVDRPDRAARRQHGKSDTIDAEAAARAVLLGRATGTPKTRDGIIEAIRVHQVVYRSAVRDRTAATNQFHAVVVSAPAEIPEDLQKMPLKQRLEQAGRWRDRARDDIASRATRQALRELALRIQLACTANPEDLPPSLARGRFVSTTFYIVTTSPSGHTLAQPLTQPLQSGL